MIKILFLAANPKDTSPLRLGEEARAIKERLRLADLRDQFVFEQEHAVRVIDLEGHLLHHQPHIVHFSGHGSRTGKIILENVLGRRKAITAGALKDLFATLKDNIRCVVLNACYSEAQAKGIVESIDCVVGMGRAIDDSSAIAFAASFYQGLGYGRSIQTAFELGKGQINLQGLPGKDVPQLKLAQGVDAAKLYLIGGGESPSSGVRPGTPKPMGPVSTAAEIRGQFGALLVLHKLQLERRGVRSETPFPSAWPKALRSGSRPRMSRQARSSTSRSARPSRIETSCSWYFLSTA